MIIGNLRSFADLQRKKSLAKDLLELEIANESENQKRVRDYKSPYVSKPIPPVYKTQAELRKDKDSLILEARNKLSSLEIDNDIVQTILSTYLTNVDDLIKFNALFPSIKYKFQRQVNPKFATVENVWDVISTAFAQINEAYGMKLNGSLTFGSIQELRDTIDIVKELRDLRTSDEMLQAEEDSPLSTKEIVQKLLDLENALPSNQFYEGLSQLDPIEKNSLFRKLESLMRTQFLPTKSEVEELIDVAPRMKFASFLSAVKKRFSTVNPDAIARIVREYSREIPAAGYREDARRDERLEDLLGGVDDEADEEVVEDAIAPPNLSPEEALTEAYKTFKGKEALVIRDKYTNYPLMYARDPKGFAESELYVALSAKKKQALVAIVKKLRENLGLNRDLDEPIEVVVPPSAAELRDLVDFAPSEVKEVPKIIPDSSVRDFRSVLDQFINSLNAPFTADSRRDLKDSISDIVMRSKDSVDAGRGAGDVSALIGQAYEDFFRLRILPDIKASGRAEVDDYKLFLDREIGQIIGRAQGMLSGAPLVAEAKAPAPPRPAAKAAEEPVARKVRTPTEEEKKETAARKAAEKERKTAEKKAEVAAKIESSAAERLATAQQDFRLFHDEIVARYQDDAAQATVLVRTIVANIFQDLQADLMQLGLEDEAAELQQLAEELEDKEEITRRQFGMFMRVMDEYYKSVYQLRDETDRRAVGKRLRDYPRQTGAVRSRQKVGDRVIPAPEKLTHGLGLKVIVDSDSSDEEEEKKKKGRGFAPRRVKIGGGIVAQQEPTYREFGKYVLHMPQLHAGRANFKYKSLGAIPTLKPVEIPDDYKEFLLDVIKSGRVDQKDLKRLGDKERKHFEKTVQGAGLAEYFDIRITRDKAEDDDLKRFEILKGEYLAGNNAPTLVKELRHHVIKFMDEGRVKRKEGMGMLMELSAV